MTSDVSPAAIAEPSRRDFRFALVSGLVIALLCGGSYWGRVSARSNDMPKSEYRLDVNEATVVEWLHVDGVGETLARRIVLNRQTHGPFVSVDDLTRVNGIGSKSVVKMLPFLRCTSPGQPLSPDQSGDKLP